MDFGKSRNYVVSILFFCLLLATFMLPSKNVKLIALGVLLIFLSVVICFFKKRNVTTINKKQVTLLFLLFGFLFLILLYFPVIKYGLYKNVWFKFNEDFFFYVLPAIFIIFIYEYIRYALLSQESKFLIFASYFLGLVVDLILFLPIGSTVGVDNLVQTVLSPLACSLSLNFLFTYISQKFDYLPNIILKLFIVLYIYVMPYIPATPELFKVLLYIVYPIIIFYIVDATYKKKKNYIPKTKKSVLGSVIRSILYVFLVSILMMVSCQFKYCMVVIGSDSMKGTFETGDVVVFEKYDGQVLDKNQIIVFNRNNNWVVHRIIDVEMINGQIRYTTKGDANEIKDDGFVVESQIVGIYDCKISYIGYPTIVLNRNFR